MNQSAYWENKWSRRPLEPANNFARRAYKLIQTKKLKTLLDLGCGDGRDAVYFFNKGLKVTAMDSLAAGINKLVKRAPGVRAIVGDIRNIKGKSDSFDIVYAHASLHYFDDSTTTKIFNNLHTILKKGGILFVKCKSTDDKLFGHGKKIGENIYLETHIRHFFTKKYLAKKLESFKIIKLRKTSSVYLDHKSSFAVDNNKRLP